MPKPSSHTVKDLECDILVVGGGLGGVAAAVRASRLGYRVTLTEQNPWLGGQCTSQGVSALDEHEHIEHFGGTATYCEWRQRIRQHYLDCYTLSAEAGGAEILNPGRGWVSRLCFEPIAGLGAILGMLLPEIDAGRLGIHYGARPVDVQIEAGRLRSVLLVQPAYERQLCIRARYVLDATELGDLLPLAGVPWVTGAESVEQTCEPHARADRPAPHLVQSFTYPFVVDFRPGEDHTIPRPAGYEKNRDRQPYTLDAQYGDRVLTYRMFEPVDGLPGSFWAYRRLVAADQFRPGQVPGDLAMINWAGNDFKGGNLIGGSESEQEEVMGRARNLSLGFLHWLQTEVPRDDGQGRGYPELRLRTDVLGTSHGLSQYPYIREARRIRARRIVREQEVLARYQPGSRAADFPDSVGLGWYPMDLHAVAGDVAATGPTRPFQIPLGALVQTHVDNLIPACKNLGVTHMTNGCYRLHPVEWNIGEAAGALAAFCLGQHRQPGEVLEGDGLLRAFQRSLLQAGVPLYWYIDVPGDHPSHAAVQMLAVEGIWPGSDGGLTFGPDEPAGDEQLGEIAARAGLARDGLGSSSRSRGELAQIVDCLRTTG